MLSVTTELVSGKRIVKLDLRVEGKRFMLHAEAYPRCISFMDIPSDCVDREVEIVRCSVSKFGFALTDMKIGLIRMVLRDHASCTPESLFAFQIGADETPQLLAA